MSNDLMAKKCVLVSGLHKVFDSLADFESGNIKATAADLVDEYSVLYITCDEEDETTFQAPYYAGTKVIWTRGNSYITTGEYVKTVNNNAPDANGNVTVSGGGSSDVPIISEAKTVTSATLSPNKMYVWDEVPDTLTINLETPASTDIVNLYMMQFTTNTTSVPDISWPDDVKWVTTPSYATDKTFQVAILNNVGMIVSVSNSTIEVPAIVNFNITTDIATTVSSTTDTNTYTVTDDQGNKVTFSIVGGGSSWSVTTGSYTYTIGSDSYTSSYQLYLEGSGSTTTRNIQVDLTGPCTIYIATRSSSTRTSRTISCYVDGTSIGTCTSGTSAVSTGTISYTGTGGTLAIYTNGACYLYHVRIDYNV